MNNHQRLLVCLTALVLAPSAWAWNPSSGDWLPDDPNVLRVMTWNIEDNVRSNNFKGQSLNSWDSIVRIIAAMKPDILMLQEAGDRPSGGVDSVANLTTACELLIHGGPDPFNGGQVGSYVQLYDPNFDLPYIWVSAVTDNFNRNVILSRYPFADLNGDNVSQYPLPDLMIAHLYQGGGTGGIRGFMFGEIDLPDAIYAGDLVVGNAHLKSGGSSSDRSDRLIASQNIAYFIDYGYNGRNGVPDPFNRLRTINAPNVLDPYTPVIIGGDWNEDESNNGRRGPADWLTQAEFLGGTDGTDRDGTDSTFDAAVEPFSGDRSTQSSSKLDYIGWQDSIATEVRSFVFNTARLGSVPNWYPPEVASSSFSSLLTGRASDHRPVIVDFKLPLVMPTAPLCADMNCDGLVDAFDIEPFILALLNPGQYAIDYPNCDIEAGDLNSDMLIDAFDIEPFIAAVLSSGCL